MKLIKIGAVWCPACLIMNNRINIIVKEYNFDYIEYDYDIDTDIKDKYKVGNILPVLIIIDKEKEILRLVGEYSEKEIINKINEVLG